MDATHPTPGTEPQRSAPAGVERSVPRDVVHVVLLTIPWAGLGWLWWNMLRHGAGGLGLAVSVVAVAAISTFAVTSGWIAHNLSIARRKGPRRGLPAGVLCYDHDWTGRPVHAVWSEVSRARTVVVVTTDGQKLFLPDPEPDRVAQATAPASAAHDHEAHDGFAAHEGSASHEEREGHGLVSGAGVSA